LKGDTNGKEKNTKRSVEHTGFEHAQTAVSHDADVKGRPKSGAQARRCKKESVPNGAQEIQGVSETHR
jgi:hypothetical protein